MTWGRTVSPFRKTPLQFDDGVLVVGQRQLRKAWDGYKFTASHRFEGVAADDGVNVLLAVPGGAGRNVFFLAFEVSSYAQAHIDLYFDVEYSGGTELAVLNLRRSLQGVVNPVAEALHTVAFTPSTHHLPLVHQGGTKQFAAGGLSEVGGAAILGPGCNVVIAVVNKSTAAQDLSIRMVWWEEPFSQLP